MIPPRQRLGILRDKTENHVGNEEDRSSPHNCEAVGAGNGADCNKHYNPEVEDVWNELSHGSYKSRVKD